MEELTGMPVSTEGVPSDETATAQGGDADTQAIDRMLREIIEMAVQLACEKALAQKTDAGAVTQEPAEDRTRFIEELLRQEDEIRLERPDFDLTKTIAESGAFRVLILAGEPVAKALEYIEPERSRERMEEDVLNRIRKRNLRPATMGAGNRPGGENAQDRFDEDEMRRIDAQLKRGQKVYI